MTNYPHTTAALSNTAKTRDISLYLLANFSMGLSTALMMLL